MDGNKVEERPYCQRQNDEDYNNNNFNNWSKNKKKTEAEMRYMPLTTYHVIRGNKNYQTT